MTTAYAVRGFIWILPRPPPPEQRGFYPGVLVGGSVAEPGLLRRTYNPRERVNARSEGPNPSGPANMIAPVL
jgi:hypothetical protein